MKQPLPVSKKGKNMFGKVTRPSIFDRKDNQESSNKTYPTDHNREVPQGRVLFENG
jgi:hypothetical protein